ncbi:hypothetical protein TELCIR_18401, partial [Teladorsagia circumcincta]
ASASVGGAAQSAHGAVITEDELPPQFRRPLIDQEECDAINAGGAYARQRRHRKLIKADATSSLIRTLRYRLKEVLPKKSNEKREHHDELNALAEHTDDTVADLVLAIGTK